MFIVAGATGHTGSVVARELIAAGKKVRVLARSKEKARPLEELGAEVALVGLHDSDALARVLEGAEGAYLLSPPDAASTSFLADRRKLLDGVARAVARAELAHPVFLSSVGAQQPAGTGIVQSVSHGERAFLETGKPVTFVRAAYFVENWGAVLPAAQKDGVLPSFIPEDLTLPQVSTVDIGRTAARALLDGPRGTRILELAGPRDASPKDVAAAVSRLLGKPVKVAPAPLEAVVPTFTSFGISPDVAELYRQLYQGIIDGSVRFQGPPAELVRGEEPLEATLQRLLGTAGTA